MEEIFNINDLLVVATGIVAGFFNVVAAGGSLISLPILIFLGLPAPVANATNRLAIFFQNLVGIAVYSKKKSIDFKSGIWLVIPAVLGAIVGSYIAVFLNEYWMRKVIAVVMLLMAITMFINPKKWIQGSNTRHKNKISLKEFIVFFGIGIYGGFIQAGVGIILLAGLVLVSGFNLVQSNPIKLLIVLFYTFFSIFIFAYNDLIWWKIGLTLSIGNMIGAWVGAHLSLKGGSNFIRWSLIIVIIFSSTKLLEIW